MKEYEYLGVMASMVAYYLIATGSLTIGFKIGIIASVALVIYCISIKSWGMFTLQLYFICANIFGLYNLGIRL